MDKSKFSFYSLESAFIIVGLIFGLAFVFINPPFHANDEDRHFYHSYFISEGVLSGEKQGDKIGGMLPKNLVESVQSFQGIPFMRGDKISEVKLKESLRKKLNPDDKVFWQNHHYKRNPIPFLPYSIGILIGKIINSNPVALNRAARIFGLLCYLVIVFFAIRFAPVFKSVFFLYALTPMVLYQGSSVTYDMLSNGLSFLLVALFLKYALEKDKTMGAKDFVLIVIIAIIHRYSKDGYFLIPFLFFLIPFKKIGSPLKIAGMAVFFIILYFLPGWTWDQIVSGLKAGGATSLKKDFLVNVGMNLQINLAQPLQFVGNIFSNIMHFRQEWIGGAIGRFGYSYTLLPGWFFAVHGLVLLTVALIDGKAEFPINKIGKLLIFIVGFGTLFMVIVGMYLSSPVGAKMIFGLQGRYFIPAVPIVLLLLYNTKFEPVSWNKWKIPLLSIYAIITLIYTTVYMNDAFYGI